MRKVFFIFITILLVLCVNSYAHPPSEMRLSYNSDTKILRVEIKHQVINPKTHYVKRVVVKLQDRVIFTHNIKEQSDRFAQVFEYAVLNAKFSDVITVTAYCNQGGTITEELSVF